MLCYCCYHYHYHHHHHHHLRLHHLVKLWLSELTRDICVVKGYLLTRNNKSSKISEEISDTAANYQLLISVLAYDKPDAQFFNTFITVLYMYMFRAISCSSSGGQIVLIQHLVSSLSVSDCPVHRFSTCAPDVHLLRVTIPDAVLIQFDFRRMSKILFETCTCRRL